MPHSRGDACGCIPVRDKFTKRDAKPNVGEVASSDRSHVTAEHLLDMVPQWARGAGGSVLVIDQ